jgi:hypothetical protein
LVQVNVHPRALADLLWNASLLAEAPDNTNGMEYVLLEVNENKLKAYAPGSHVAGWGAIDLNKVNEQGEASAVITRNEAIDLQSMLRKESGAKAAQVIVEISEDGVEYDGALANLVITGASATICALEDADPDGVLSDHWDHLEELCARRESEGTDTITFKTDVLGILKKLKPPRDFLTMRLSKERYVQVTTEGWIIVVADARPLFSDELMEGASSLSVESN